MDVAMCASDLSLDRIVLPLEQATYRAVLSSRHRVLMSSVVLSLEPAMLTTLPAVQDAMSAAVRIPELLVHLAVF